MASWNILKIKEGKRTASPLADRTSLLHYHYPHHTALAVTYQASSDPPARDKFIWKDESYSISRGTDASPLNYCNTGNQEWHEHGSTTRVRGTRPALLTAQSCARAHPPATREFLLGAATSACAARASWEQVRMEERARSGRMDKSRTLDLTERLMSDHSPGTESTKSPSDV